ncbi:energy transducer TonB [Pseudomonas putida]|uniref:energy transducer TonB n=1 Tax=Pseudomonas putida TaxID=303 RepID=UPI001575A206|nr:energy transducer TonB [Pseudomonas putida]NTY90252.1 energy transducer TonB [Pseudomonas putida]NTY98794.1 energy transducer TonB [Pseudomonas putida]NTZ21077.1 energy transducer TonB [Pseudomonas putida]NTZ53404.1 energy transducer TonB [Pseudomonas putida]NTZ64505.1 energy transducer TonB [Pseudomonas putida]
MSNLTFDPASWRDHGVAFGVACALHAGLAYLLFNLSHTPELAAVPAAVIHTQLVSLPAPVVVPEPPAPEPVIQPVPKAQAPVVDEAALALRRVQQQKRDLQHKRDQQQRQEQEQARKQREEAERREQQLAQQEQARQQQAREAAAQARAAAEAASRQYLPIAKEAPDYPQRALDRNIEGECTVAYTVTPQGQVSDPQVVGQCHPLFVKPSLAAAKRFRYQPRVVNGQAVAVANVKNTFTYKIR